MESVFLLEEEYDFPETQSYIIVDWMIAQQKDVHHTTNPPAADSFNQNPFRAEIKNFKKHPTLWTLNKSNTEKNQEVTRPVTLFSVSTLMPAAAETTWLDFLDDTVEAVAIPITNNRCTKGSQADIKVLNGRIFIDVQMT